MKPIIFSGENPFDEINSSKKSIFSFFNFHNIWWAKDSKKYSNILKKDFTIFPDGKNLARVLLTSQKRGPAFTKGYFLSEEAKDKKHFFIGLAKENHSKILEATGLPKKNIIPYHSAGTKNPKITSLSNEEIDKLSSMINKSKADYVWLGISSPKQEFVAKQLFSKTKVKKFICIGAGLDFLLKKKKEAPSIWQKVGVEWLYRLITDYKHSKLKVIRSFKGLSYILRKKLKIAKEKQRSKKDLAVVYLAAGVSSRFNNKPKSLQIVGKQGKTLMEYSLDQALKAGFNKIFIIVGDKTEELFKKRMGNSYRGVQIEYVKQTFNSNKRDKPWGQIDALCTLKGKISCPFVVCNGDDLYGYRAFKKLHDHFSSDSKGEAASVYYGLGKVLPGERPVNRGIFKTKGKKVTEVKETYSISRTNLKEKGLSLNDKCSMGIFALTPQIIHKLSFLLERFKQENKNNKDKEFPFGDGLSTLIKEGKLTMKVYYTNSIWAGVTTPADLPFVEQYIKKDYLGRIYVPFK